MNKHNHRERLELILAGERPDRFAASFWRHFYHLENHAEGMIEAIRLEAPALAEHLKVVAGVRREIGSQVEKIKTTRDPRRLIIGSGCSLPPEVPMDNLQAIRDKL